MSLDNDDSHSSDIPVLYADEEGKVIITWNKNIASVTGTLSLVGRAIRTQQPDLHKLIEMNIVEERGITYIDDPAKIDLLEDKALQPYVEPNTFDKPWNVHESVLSSNP